MTKQPRSISTLDSTTRYFNKAIGVYEQLIKVNTKLNDNWAVAKNYEGIIESQMLRDKNSLNVERVLQLCDTAIDLFAMENSLNTIFQLMDKVAK